MSNEVAVKQEEIESYNQQATALVISDTETYARAGQLWSAGKAMVKLVEGFFKPLKQKADEAKKALLDAEKAEIAKIQPGLDHLNKIQTAWYIEQERIRKAEEERLRREAEKAEEERRLQAAILAEQAGEKEEAAAILEEPVYVPPPIVEKTVPKVNGQTMQTNWKWKLIDINVVPRQYLTTNDVAINAAVRTLKDKTNIPGIEAYPEQSMRGTRQ